MKKIALLIGVDQYEHLGKLDFVREDVRRMKAILTEPCGFELWAEPLTGTSADNRTMIKTLKDFFAQPCDPETLLLFYFSGHGLTNRDKSQAYLACYNTERDSDGEIWNGIDMSDIKYKYLEGKLRARQVIIIFDCCHAGASIGKGWHDEQNFLQILEKINLGKIQSGALNAKGHQTIIRASCLLAACQGSQEAFATEDGTMSRYTRAFINALCDPAQNGFDPRDGSFRADTVAAALLRYFREKDNRQLPIDQSSAASTIVFHQRPDLVSTDSASATVSEPDNLFDRLQKQEQFFEEIRELYHELMGYELANHDLGSHFWVKKTVLGADPATGLVGYEFGTDKIVDVARIQRLKNMMKLDSKTSFARFITRAPISENARQAAAEAGIRIQTPEQVLDGLINFSPYVDYFRQDMKPAHPEQISLLDAYVELDCNLLNVTAAKENARCQKTLFKTEPDMEFDHETDPAIEIDPDNKDIWLAPAISQIYKYVLDWLEKERTAYHISILGDFGAGKTSFSRMLTHRLLQTYWRDGQYTGARLPLYIPLMHFSRLEGDGGVEALLAYYFNHVCQVQDYHWPRLKKLLRAGKLLFILDGFDEMVQKVDQKTRSRNFRLLAELAVQPNRIILTGRPGYFPALTDIIETFADKESAADKFQILKLKPLTQHQVDEYLVNYSQWQQKMHLTGWELTQPKVKELIEKNKSIDELSERPVLLWMIVKALPKLQHIPIEKINVADLYRRFTDDWLERDDDKGEFRRYIATAERREFMQELFWQMWQRVAGHETIDERKVSIKEADLERAVQDHFQIEKATEVEYRLNHIRTCTFLKHDTSFGYHTYIHRSFMEYFVAAKAAPLLLNGTCPDMTISPAIRDFIFALLHEKWTPPHFSGPLPPGLTKDGQRIICEKDGAEMVWIAPGPCLLGGKYGWTERIENIPGFFMDRHPVTNERFGKFMAEGGYQNPDHWTEEGWKFIQQKKISEPGYWQDKKWNDKLQPVVRISWYEAAAFAHWAGKQLPHEKQWEKAARGLDGRIYAWGDAEPDQERANFVYKIGQTTPVENYPDGQSPYGLFDCAGNVWEWCENAYSVDDTLIKVVRGGSWYSSPDLLRCSYRSGDDAGDRNDSLGFRCLFPAPGLF